MSPLYWLRPMTLFSVYVLLAAAAVASSSLRMQAESSSDRVAGTSGADAARSAGTTTIATPYNQTVGAATAQVASGKFGDRRRQVIRGEREAAVITRLPQMKVSMITRGLHAHAHTAHARW